MYVTYLDGQVLEIEIKFGNWNKKIKFFPAYNNKCTISGMAVQQQAFIYEMLCFNELCPHKVEKVESNNK